VRILETRVHVKQLETPKKRISIDKNDIVGNISLDQFAMTKNKEILMSDSKNILGGIAIGVLAGVVIGSAVALLSAPKPGVQTRAQLLEKGDEIRNRAAVSLQETRNRASQTLQETRSRADAVLSDVRSRSLILSDRVKQHKNGIDHPFKEIVAE
jgi:gas vesicle protein